MAEYSYNEIMKMQNDALRRVNEMQQKARNVVEGINASNTPKEEKQHISTSPERIKMPNDYLEELKSFASTSSYFEKESNHDSPHAPFEGKKQEPIKTASPHNTQNDTLKKIFGELSMDSDKTLLLSLILLLSEEKADEMLILALLYILN